MRRIGTGSWRGGREIGLKTVSIVGYTNAGKSTLFNTLTGKNTLSKNVLFATLDSTVGKLRLPNNETVIISDTIGFIQNLPEKLIDAFKSTLMEAINASLLLHVIDASDHLMNEKIAVVENVLANLRLQEKEKIYVFTKIDRLHHFTKHDFKETYAKYTPQCISSTTGEGISELTETIRSKI